MQLRTRFWLSGAVLPALVMAALLFAAQSWFRYALEQSLDQALLAQAAVESVSLFDGPERRPHLHMASSPLVDSVRAFAPEGVLFGPDGREVMRYPPAKVTRPRETLAPGKPAAPPVMETQERAGARERTLTVTVRAPSGEPYSLRLTAGLAQVDAALSISRRVSIAALLLATLALALLQSWQGISLKRRLAELSVHVQALRAGDLERALVPETAHDELAELRALLRQTTFALKQARDGKERLLADAAHELRTPLTLMRTSLDLALRRDRSPDELKSALRDTRVEVDRLAELASRLLDTAALSHVGEPREICDVAGLLRRAIEQIEPERERRGLKIELVAGERELAEVRPHGLRQAVDNLLSNALKYAASVIRVELKRDTDKLVLSVADDGPGVHAGEREAIFEPFHRLSHAGPGAGLGLAIVREVARAHEGRAFVQQSVKGAELRLELALGSAAAGAGAVEGQHST